VTVTRSLVMSSERHSRRTRATGLPDHERACHDHPDAGMLTVAASADVGCTWRAQSGPSAAVAYGDDAAVARHAMNRLIWLADLSVPMFRWWCRYGDLRARLRGRQAELMLGCSAAAFPLTARQFLARLLVPRHLDIDPLAAAAAAGESSPDLMESLVSAALREPAEGEGSHGS
jgi:hypothetical protein